MYAIRSYYGIKAVALQFKVIGSTVVHCREGFILAADIEVEFIALDIRIFQRALGLVIQFVVVQRTESADTARLGCRLFELGTQIEFVIESKFVLDAGIQRKGIESIVLDLERQLVGITTVYIVFELGAVIDFELDP